MCVAHSRSRSLSAVRRVLEIITNRAHVYISPFECVLGSVLRAFLFRSAFVTDFSFSGRTNLHSLSL